MKVINREIGKFDGNSYVTYTFSSGHEYRVHSNGAEFAYTPKGNYTQQLTMRKLCRIASEYEDTRVQFPD